MKFLERGWRYLLAEPFIWIVYCFFQPARFHREIEIPGYFKLKRMGPILRVGIPLLLCSFLFFCCALYLSIMFHSFIINTSKFLSMTAWLLLGLIILTISGGIILSTARGITLACAWGIVYTLTVLFFSYDLSNFNTFSFIMLGFGLIGGMLFGTVFGTSNDLFGDLIGSIIWAAAVVSIRLVTVHTWNSFDLLFASVPIGSIVGGVIWFMMRSTKNPKGEKVLKKSLLWGNIWGISLAIVASTSDPSSSSVALSALAYAVFCFFGAAIYIAGYYRILLYPFSCFSTLSANFLSKLYPSNIFYYLHRCSLYWDECVFLPLFGLKQILLIAAQQEEDGRRILEELIFIIKERPQQIAIARAVLQELAMWDVEKRTELPDIAQAYERLSAFLPKEVTVIDPQWMTLFSPLQDVSHDAERYLHAANRKAQQRMLQSMIANLERARAKIPFGNAGLNKRLSEVINTWLAATQQEYERLGEAPSTIGQMDNPFSPGQPLKLHDSLFVGRLDLARQLEDALSRANHRPIFLLNGERRMGKTSVLMQLPALLGPRYLPLFYDLQQRGTSSSTGAFLTSVAREICEVMQAQGIRAEKLEYARLQEANQKNEAVAYHLFEEWLHNIERDLEQEDKTLLLTFDEFEILAEAGNALYLNLSLLLDWFGSVMQNYPRLALLFSGERTFSEMGPRWVSHFVTVQTLRVSFLRSAEVRKLITQVDDPDVSAEHLFNEDIIEEIIRVTACHPFLVQAICSVLIDSLNAEERTQALLSDVETAVHQVLDRWNDYFMDVWIRADSAQKSCLTTIARLDGCNLLDVEQQTGLDNQTARRAVQHLLKRDLIRIENDNYRIAVPIFRQWMEQNNDLSEPDVHDSSSDRIDDLLANDDFESSDEFDITILPSPPHISRSKSEVNTAINAEFEQEKQASRSRSAVRHSPMRSSIPRPTRLLLISLTLLLIIAGGVLIVPATLNRFANRSATTRATATLEAATATVLTNAANPDPYLPGGGRLMLYDALTKSNSAWQSISGTCTFKNDGYHVTQYPVWFTMCLSRSANFSNYVFEARMKIITGDGGGIAFRATYNHYSGYTLFLFKNGHYQLTLYTNGRAAKTFAVGTSTAIKQGLNQTNVLAVIAQSSSIKLYANHQLIAHFNDGIYSQGQIGFIANAMSSSADVTYTDAKIWAL